MWRLLIVGLIGLIPLAASMLVEETGYRVTFPPWLGPPVRSAFETTQPPANWLERGYLAANPDVAEAVRWGAFASGYDHYVTNGQYEGRRGGFVGVAEMPVR
ncbi:MAG TPA: hypothetical protein VD978_01280 [Azospirillum sp.]|nr:hypothetical protein [Azospirillum sp.]